MCFKDTLWFVVVLSFCVCVRACVHVLMGGWGGAKKKDK